MFQEFTYFLAPPILPGGRADDSAMTLAPKVSSHPSILHPALMVNVLSEGNCNKRLVSAHGLLAGVHLAGIADHVAVRAAIARS